jgi:hypothetical protein
MSRWLSNVGNFLDQLDNKAAVAVTAAVTGRNPNDDDHYYDDDEDDHVVVDTLLYKPTNTIIGPNTSAESTMYEASEYSHNYDDDVVMDHEENAMYNLDTIHEQEHSELYDNSISVTETSLDHYHQSHEFDILSSNVIGEKEGQSGDDEIHDHTERSSNVEGRMSDESNPVQLQEDTDKIPSTSNLTSTSGNIHGNNVTATSTTPGTPFQTPQQSAPREENNHEATDTVPERSDERIRELQQELQYYQQRFVQLQHEKHQEVAVLTKEARTLRRHLATLNEQLSAADKEVGAQRKELEDAATRLESDRVKYKQDIQSAVSKHATEIQKLTRSHQDTIASMQLQSQNQSETLKKELQGIQQQRKQEGGDWHKELEDAVRREKDALGECAKLQEEKVSLFAHIAILQSQQETLGSQLESLTAVADNAASREREAELRLDDAMSMHARQISQRQTREAELERTVSELSAALVLERSKHNLLVISETSTNQAPGDATSQDNNSALEMETMKAQLDVERQQNASLRHELNEVIRERQEDLAVSQKRQIQHDRKISDVSQQLAELRATVREAKQDTSNHRKPEDSILDAQRIHDLTEELVRMRERISISNSEVSALRNRLQSALNRAVVAEAAAEATFSPTESNWQADPERGINVRRRGGNSRNTNGKASSTDTPTIRAALHLESVHGNGNGSSSQSIGKGLDILDNFLAQSGEILRFNPFARLLFGTFCCIVDGCFAIVYGRTNEIVRVSDVSTAFAYMDLCPALFSCSWF